MHDATVFCMRNVAGIIEPSFFFPYLHQSINLPCTVDLLRQSFVRFDIQPQNATERHWGHHAMPCHAMPCYAALSVLGLYFHVDLSSMARTCACTHEHLSWLV